MKTIFNYNPTNKELKELFSFNPETKEMAYGFSILPLPIDVYDESTEEEKLLDLAQLLELRNENEKAQQIWAKIPDIERQYRGGFDYEIKEI